MRRYEEGENVKPLVIAHYIVLAITIIIAINIAAYNSAHNYTY